ncbi:MAG TPA: histidine--tRNA ligase [Pirellulales bacterium]|jgi:histidyl-tRNA synthetase|nr:histidine--tRNA ligase [Pirellulales bacterium]
MITPRTLKGFRDYLPEQMIPRERMIATAQRVYRSYGFSPIDTPALEYLEILAGKGGEESDKQMYRFTDHGGREVGMRFDLTVPLARFAAQHFAELGTPFKRYHIATVWRGENTQRGRYREFMQCDFDTIGTLSAVADIETALVIHDLLRAIGFEEFTIHVNNRMVLNGLLAKLGLAERSKAVLIALDKVHKIGPEKVSQEMMATAGATQDQANQLLSLAQIRGTSEEVLSQLGHMVAGNELGEAGVGRLAEIVSAVQAGGVPGSKLVIDAVIARGLDYYTGTIYETFLNALPDLGSICSGGRYDNLAALYTNQQLPGIGASLGLDRLLAGMEELGMLPKVATPAEIFIPYFDEKRLHNYLRLAAQLRAAGFGVEVFPEAKKLGQQLKYADRRGFRVALVAGENEFAAGNIQIKNLATTTSETVPLTDSTAELIAALRRTLTTSNG